MELALADAALAASRDEVPVGAVVVKDGQIVARAGNRREEDQDPTAHAEVLALGEAARKLGSWRLTGCTLYVTLEPCPMCLGAAQQSRVDRVVYAAKDPKGGALSLGYPFHEDQRLNHRFPVEYVADERCERVLKEFFKAKRTGGNP